MQQAKRWIVAEATPSGWNVIDLISAPNTATANFQARRLHAAPGRTINVRWTMRAPADLVNKLAVWRKVNGI